MDDWFGRQPLCSSVTNWKQSSYKCSELRHRCEKLSSPTVEVPPVRYIFVLKVEFGVKNVRCLGIEPNTFDLSTDWANHQVTSLDVLGMGTLSSY